MNDQLKKMWIGYATFLSGDWPVTNPYFECCFSKIPKQGFLIMMNKFYFKQGHKIKQIRNKRLYICYPITDCPFNFHLNHFLTIGHNLNILGRKNKMLQVIRYSPEGAIQVCSLKLVFLKVFGRLLMKYLWWSLSKWC